MLTIDPKDVSPARMHSYLLGSVIPRPIALASTVDLEGHVNLSPFSFFNCFSTNPPILVFSPSRRGRDNTTKHTYQNVKDVPEVVINIVTFEMVQQVSLTSTEYPHGVNEFVKSGLTPVPSLVVRPPRVGESPVAMECKVNQVLELGNLGASGNLVICEVLRMHVKEEVIGPDGRVDPRKLDAVARMGGDDYVRVQGDQIFKVPKPNDKLGIGFDQLPPNVLESEVLSGNDLGQLANVSVLPGEGDFREVLNTDEFLRAKKAGLREVHALAKRYIREGKLGEAWSMLLATNPI